jgi:hypothetical protein
MNNDTYLIDNNSSETNSMTSLYSMKNIRTQNNISPDFIDDLSDDLSNDLSNDLNTLDTFKNDKNNIKNANLMINNIDHIIDEISHKSGGINRGVSEIINHKLEPQSNSSNSTDNGWNNKANKTISNWYITFKELSFIYHWVLARNTRISNILSIISILSSAILGIFSAFKLWVNDDHIFQAISSVILMVSNFIIALITALSKSYLDGSRNEKIRKYIQDLDNLLGDISGQILNSPIYRTNANEFFKLTLQKYNKLISFKPFLNFYEIKQSQKEYEIYKKFKFNNI